MKINGIREERLEDVMAAFERDAAVFWAKYNMIRCRGKCGPIRDWHYGPFDENDNHNCVICGQQPEPGTQMVSR